MRRVVEVHGQRGETWLEELPARITACERRWSIAVHAAFPNLSYNWVAPATASDGSSVVLKLGVPNPELSSEIDALRAWAGDGAARLVAADATEGALVLERLHPGNTLAELGLERDDAATAIATGLMRLLHRSPSKKSRQHAPVLGLRTLADWTNGLVQAKTTGFAPSLIDRAMAVRDQLLATSPPAVLLHGDLQHFNILSGDRQRWLAIDPKGVVGDPAYEPAPFLYNPIERVLGASDSEEIVVRRIDHLAEYCDRRRIIGWALVHGVLSAWWQFEDHGGGHEPRLRVAELMARIR